MALNTLPPGWSTDQLAALNELQELVDAYDLIVKVRAALGDTSAAGTRVQTDIVTMVQGVCARLVTYPPATP